METFISVLFILAVLGMGVFSFALCIYYLGKIAVSTFTYYKLGPEKFHQKMSENSSSHAAIGTTKTTTEKQSGLSFIASVLEIFSIF
jgi:hypothetical protein